MFCKRHDFRDLFDDGSCLGEKQIAKPSSMQQAASDLADAQQAVIPFRA
jgi:hypothetical protein